MSLSIMPPNFMEIGQLVFELFCYKQTNKQTNRQKDRQANGGDNIYPDFCGVSNNIVVWMRTCIASRMRSDVWTICV